MDDKIIQAAETYKRMALSLAELDVEGSLGAPIAPEAETALIALYYAKALEARIEKCEELLTEETGEAAVEALVDAAAAVETTAADARMQIERYVREDRDFETELEQVSVNSETGGLYTELLKLYKCEDIIAAAYRFASAHSYVSAPEDFIARHMDIDIKALLDIRRALLGRIGKTLVDMP